MRENHTKISRYHPTKFDTMVLTLVPQLLEAIFPRKCLCMEGIRDSVPVCGMEPAELQKLPDMQQFLNELFKF